MSGFCVSRYITELFMCLVKSQDACLIYNFIRFGFRPYRGFSKAAERLVCIVSRVYFNVLRVVPSRCTVRSESGRHACVTGYFCLDPRDSWWFLGGNDSGDSVPVASLSDSQTKPIDRSAYLSNDYSTSEEVDRISFTNNDIAMRR